MNETKKYFLYNIIITVVAVVMSIVALFSNYKITSKVYTNVLNGEVDYTSQEITFMDAVSKASKSCVVVQAKQSSATSLGSGVFYAVTGNKNYAYIVTNFHVIDNAFSFSVVLYDGTVLTDVQLVGGDEKQDIAVLMVKNNNYQIALMRNIETSGSGSNPLILGETCFAVGNPLGSLGGSVTKGIISSTNRSINLDSGNAELLQTDAAINSGNSGGGLFDSNGNLIGIVNAKVSSAGVEGLGFAIPISNANQVANSLITTSVYNEYGKITSYGYVEGRAYIGFEAQTMALTFFTTYVGVSSIDTNSNAYTQGLRVQDVLTSISLNGETTTISSLSNFTDAIKDLKIKDEITLKFIRLSSTGENQEKIIIFRASQYIYYPPKSS